jgi:pimeloyl-ACP methyl ester carboxylesterase
MRIQLFAIFIFLTSTVSAQKIEYTFSIPNDTTKNFYITIYPEGKPKGTLILLPGFGELPTETIIDADIYKYSSREGYLTIIPALGDWSFFYLDSLSHQTLNEFLVQVFKKYKLPNENFFIGGFSLGGTMAIQYAERALQTNSKLKKPAGVFAIDPPLDWERMYYRMIDKSRKLSPATIEENNYLINRIQETFKTNPKENPQYFWKISPFSKSDTSHTALKSILKLPIRIYNEPDINWYIDNRYADYSDINVFDSSAMINWLKILGNEKAELIITSGKGYRIARKMRHPHSWTIADGQELIEWMNKNKNGL